MLNYSEANIINEYKHGINMKNTQENCDNVMFNFSEANVINVSQSS